MRVHAHSHQYSEIINFVQEFFHTNHQTYSQSAWEALVEGARNGNTGNSLFMNESTIFPLTRVLYSPPHLRQQSAKPYFELT